MNKGSLTLGGPIIIPVQCVRVISSSFSKPQLIVPSPTPFWPCSNSSNRRKFRGTTMKEDLLRLISIEKTADANGCRDRRAVNTGYDSRGMRSCAWLTLHTRGRRVLESLDEAGKRIATSRRDKDIDNGNLRYIHRRGNVSRCRDTAVPGRPRLTTRGSGTPVTGIESQLPIPASPARRKERSAGEYGATSLVFHTAKLFNKIITHLHRC